MHKPYTNMEAPKVSFPSWDGFNRQLLRLAFIVSTVGGISGCSGLAAYLQYNERRVQGCIDVPIDWELIPFDFSLKVQDPREVVPPLKEAAVSQDFCLPTSEGGITPTP